MSYALEELIDMKDRDFHNAVVEDMFETARGHGPFQQEAIIERTLTGLMEWLWITNAKIDERAEDPDCSAELYANTVKFRHHILSIIDITEKRIGWLHGVKERDLQRWKQMAHEIIDAIMEGKDDEEILSIKIPYPGRGAQEGESPIDLETWWEIRRAKDPRRVKPSKEAA